MGKIQIMTDSASDISPEDEEALPISILPYPIMFRDRTYISRVELDNDQFYRLLAQSGEIPKTAQLTTFQFEEIYLQQAEDDVDDLILVLINSKGSATYQNAVAATRTFFEAHPEFQQTFRIHVLDGLGYSSLYGAPVVKAAQMAQNGTDCAAILQYLRDILPRREIYFGIYDLTYAAKSGRIPTAAAFLGAKLNMHPVMKIYGQEIVTAAKCRGDRRLIEGVVDLCAADMEPGSPYELIYGSDSACAGELRQQLTARLGYGPAASYQIGAAIAANSGPRIVGASFTRKQ